MIRSNRAVNSLRGFGTFNNASLRLLDDIIDTSDSRQIRPRSLNHYAARAKDTSFSLYWSLDLEHWQGDIRDGPPLHLMWLCEKPGLGAPLEALAHLLAHNIARVHDEPAAVATVVGNSKKQLSITMWDNGAGPVKKGVVAADTKSIEKHLGVGPKKKRPFCHLIIVQPTDGRVPRDLEQQFHRVVAVTDETDLQKLPDQLENLPLILKCEVFKKGDRLPHYSALVPTIIVPPGGTPAPKGSSLRRAAGALLGAGQFQAETIAAAFEAPQRDDCWRLRRDRCRLALNLGDLAERWQRSKSKGSRSSMDLDDLNEAGAQWARAVTNRQVGLALSGGGACCYRLVPLINELHRKKVPIDVVGGVSGGALLGAYYCALGNEGIKMAIEQGPQIGWYGFAAMVDSRALQFKIDYDLGSARVEDLKTRFVAITTALQDDRRPEGQAVVRGTVGEAVRVSGSAPIQFGRTIMGNTRYSDGASTVMIPARALRDYGADFVFACNAIPGPATCNPFSGLESKAWFPLQAATNFLINYTELGRLVDAWIAGAFLVEQGSREVEEDASEYAEPEAGPAPLYDGFRFWAAKELAAEPTPTPAPQAAEETRKPTKGTKAKEEEASDDGSAALATAGGRFASRWETARTSPRLSEYEKTEKQLQRGGRGRCERCGAPLRRNVPHR